MHRGSLFKFFYQNPALHAFRRKMESVLVWMFPRKHHVWLWIWTLGAILSASAVLYLLDRYLNSKQRRRLVLTMTFVAGWFYAFEYLLPGIGKDKVNFLTAGVQPLGYACSVIGAFPLAMGIINLGRIHGANIARSRPGWYNSVAFFISLIAMMIVATLNDLCKRHAFHMHGDIYFTMYDIAFTGFQTPLGASVFASLGFYITTAAYRAFRVKSREATILLVAGFIVMLGQVPVGNYLTSWIHQSWAPIGGPHGFHLANLRIEKLAYWILTVPNAAAIRGISFGLEIGGVAMCLRMWFSLERGSYYDKEF